MNKSDIEMLEKLNQLRENKILTDEEFDIEKNKILNNTDKNEEKDHEANNTEKEEKISINEIYSSIESEIIKEQYNLIRKVIYITAAVAIVGLVAFFGLNLLVYTKNIRLNLSIVSEIENVLNTISGYALVAWFTSTAIYLIIMLKRKIKPGRAINLLVWILGILEIAGFSKSTTSTGIVYSMLSGGLIVIDLTAMLAAYDRKKLKYKCPDCGNKIRKGQIECPSCKTKINWD